MPSSSSPRKKAPRNDEDSARSGSVSGRKSKTADHIEDGDYSYKTRAKSQQKERPKEVYGLDGDIMMRQNSRRRNQERKNMTYVIGGGDISAIPAMDSEAQLEGVRPKVAMNNIVSGGTSL